MNIVKFAALSLKRDWKAGELWLIGVSIVLAVACLTSVHFFTDRVQRATALQAKELLAADLVLISSRKIDDAYIRRAEETGLIWSLNESFRSVITKADSFELVEVKAVDERYPIRGNIKITDTLFGEERITNAVPPSGSVWVDSRLLQSLPAGPGDMIGLGALTPVIDRIITYEPDRGGDLFNIAPRLLMNRADLAESGLLAPGSRVRYRLLLGGEPDAVRRYQQAINTGDDSDISVQSVREARPEIRTALERAEQFLGLAALVSVALAGLAIAMAARRYAVRHYDNCAILRCLGLQQRQITQLYLTQLLALGLLCSLAGCIFGYIAQEGLNRLMTGMLQNDLPPPSLVPIASGIMTGLIAVLAFALPQLMRLRQVSPLRVLRRDLGPRSPAGYLIYGMAAIALALLTPWRSGNIGLTLYILVGLLLTALLLTLSAKLMIGLLKRLQPQLALRARYGLANVIRRSSRSTAQIVGIGMGITVMLLLTLIRTDLLENWRNRLPPETPNYFLINIQADQIDGVGAFLSDSISQYIRFYPMVRGRLTHINGKAVNPEDFNDPRAQRLVAREFNLSRADEMQADNRLISGRWWDKQTAVHYFSVEEGIAETLGIKQGDILRYAIGAHDLSAEVLNLRRVEWDSFNVNFFVVANRQALADHPTTFISSFYMPESERPLLTQLVRQFPGITVFDVDAILQQVRSIMDRVVRAVEFVFIFTLLTGLAVFVAALQATHDERLRESALMSALGASRKQILFGLAMEFACLGLVTGLLSAFAASVIELILAEFVFEIDVAINPRVWIISPLVCGVIIITTGLLSTRKVFSVPPATVLQKT